MNSKLPDYKINTVNELCKDTTMFLGLDKEVIVDLFSDYSSITSSASFLSLDTGGYIKNNFIDWVSKSPLQRAIEDRNS